jgi:hypothetical protein
MKISACSVVNVTGMNALIRGWNRADEMLLKYIDISALKHNFWTIIKLILINLNYASNGRIIL